MHIQDVLARYRTTFSFEFFPPKTDEAAEQLFQRQNTRRLIVHNQNACLTKMLRQRRIGSLHRAGLRSGKAYSRRSAEVLPQGGGARCA